MNCGTSSKRRVVDLRANADSRSRFTLIAEGRLRTVRIGKLVRFIGSDLLAYQRERGGRDVRVLGE